MAPLPAPNPLPSWWPLGVKWTLPSQMSNPQILLIHEALFNAGLQGGFISKVSSGYCLNKGRYLAWVANGSVAAAPINEASAGDSDAENGNDQEGGVDNGVNQATHSTISTINTPVHGKSLTSRKTTSKGKKKNVKKKHDFMKITNFSFFFFSFFPFPSGRGQCLRE